MVLSNFHTHTVFCDGLSTAKEFADKAVALGFRSLGFSGHGYVPFDGLYSGMDPDATAEYLTAVNDLKTIYAGRLDIFAGIENDSVNLLDAKDFDYSIGSVHCVKRGGIYYSVDSRAEIVERAIAEGFGGDGLAFAIAYYEALAEFASAKRADILGHMDVVRRFNTGGVRFFDEKSPKYRSAAEAALTSAVESGYIIEVSTGPLQKGFSDEPYPALFLLSRAKALGARVMVNSDAHAADSLAFGFDRAESILKEAGFSERWEYTAGGLGAVRL